MSPRPRSNPKTHASMSCWQAEPLDRDVRKALQRLRRASGVRHVAVMPDVHLAREVCVGVAVATEGRLYPQAVGSDIGCGMSALRIRADADALDAPNVAQRILDRLADAIPILKHPRRDAWPELPEALASDALSTPKLEALKGREARAQLGTLGRGNHFLELQADATRGDLWVMVHSGSRAIGPAIQAHYRAQSGAKPTGLWSLDADSDLGRGFVCDMAWAVRWASASRHRMAIATAHIIADLVGAEHDPESWCDTTHNHVALEHHPKFGGDVWVHRKGAMPAHDGVLGIVPGSMGSASYHVVGRGCAGALASSAHGAGRALSRADARRRVSVGALERQMEGVWWNAHHAPRLREEAPMAYKNIGRVMRAQRDLVRIVRRLEPRLNFKGC